MDAVINKTVEIFHTDNQDTGSLELDLKQPQKIHKPDLQTFTGRAIYTPKQTCDK